MKLIAQVVSWLALAATLVPSVLYLSGNVDLSQVKNWMLAATVVWFVAVPWWMGRKTA